MSHIITTTPLFVFLFSVLVFDGYRPSSVGSLAATVTYDGRALIINGRRRVLLSGSMHYPRSTPEVWPDLIAKAKEGGLDVIETYVFWNYHEPVRGQYYFEGRFDLVKFIKEVQDAGLYVHLRIGPYACAEWNYGGFPLWLHFIPGIQFRTTNTLFKVQSSTGNGFPVEMKRFLTKIVGMMMENKLYASQGGPIILSQVENEYGNIEWAYGVGGELYVQWAAAAALDFNTSVPWVMCQQEDAPDPIINTCNGFYCDQFSPNSPSKPKIWTENYSGWFLSFGYAIPYRPVEDLAFSVARFFETGGTFQNYYMYFGGTNFGRTAGGPLIATSYDYDAPIDEYGFLRQPKWGHLRDLHQAIKLCEEYIVNSDPTYMHLGKNLEAHIYYKGHEGCAAFLANIDNTSDAYVTFNGSEYYLPAWSVSILPDCTNEIYNTAKVVSQWNLGDFSYNRTATIYQNLSSWSWYKEHVGIWSNNSFTTLGLLEQINTTKDVTDFLWYSTSINLQGRNLRSKEVFLHVDSLGHAALLFVNKRLQGIWSGNHDDSSFIIHTKITLSAGNNTIDLLNMMIGVQNYGPWFDVAAAGIFSVSLIGTEREDLSFMKWTYQIGVEGEYLGLFKSSEVNNPMWISGDRLPVNQSLIWYKVIINVPEGTGPLALNLGSMGKGRAWVNGQSIGRYWPAYLSPKTGCSAHCDYRGTYDSFKCLKSCGKPTQTLYHLPRSWVQSGDNLLILHEELGGDPTKITVIAKTSQAVCINVAESDPPLVGMWKSMLSTSGKIASEAKLVCEQGWNITSIEFASFGTPEGECGKFTHGACSAESVQATVWEACVGGRYCSFPVSTAVFGDPCPGLLKRLAIEAICGVSHNLS